MRDWRYQPVASSDVDDDDDGIVATRHSLPRYALPVAGLVVLAMGLFVAFSGRPVPTTSEPQREERLEQESPPKTIDIVHIVLDDVGHNDLWASGDLNASEVTPRITGLARAGLVLDNYYGQSYCTPARAAMLSGKWPHKLGFAGADARGGVVEIRALTNYSLPLGHRLVPDVLKTLGYATHGIGKWNIGHCRESYLPWRRGFDTFLGYFSSGIHYTQHVADTVEADDGRLGHLELANATYALRDLQLYENASTFAWDTASKQFAGQYTTKLFTREALSRLDRDIDSPRYVWLAYHGMHDDAGVDATDAADGDFGSTMTSTRAAFARGLAEIDAGIGSIVDLLARRTASSSYVVVLHPDNGAYPCAEYCAGNNMPLRGLKFFDFEGALKLPALIYSPLLSTTRHFTPYSKLMHHVDWLATFAALAGADVDELLDSDDYDSLNHWPTMLDAAANLGSANDYEPRDEIVFSVDSESASLRQGRFKLMLNRSISDYFAPDLSPPGCLAASSHHFLFDLENDPTESTNLWNHPDYLDDQEKLVTRAQHKFEHEYFDVPYPRNDQVTAEIEEALLRSTPDDNTKILVPWGCDIIHR